MKRTNAGIIEAFVAGETNAKVGNLRIEGNKLINYSTILAERIGDEFAFNETRYSSSTSRIQSLLRRELQGKQVRTISDIRMGYTGSMAFI